jgi:hypothetical protein
MLDDGGMSFSWLDTAGSVDANTAQGWLGVAGKARTGWKVMAGPHQGLGALLALLTSERLAKDWSR